MSNDIDCADIAKDAVEIARMLKKCDPERIKQMRVEDKEFDDAFTHVVRFLSSTRPKSRRELSGR